MIELHQAIDLRAFGRAHETMAQAKRHAVGGRGAAFFHHETRKGLRGLDVHGVVHRHQRLQGRVGRHTAHRTHVAVRRIEGGHGGIRIGAAPVGVKAASILVLAGASFPVDAAAERGLDAEIGLVGFYRHTVHLGTEQPAHSERLVAHHLGRESQPWAARVKPIGGVRLDVRRRRARGLSIRGAGDEQFHKRLGVPLQAHQLRGQPVE